MFFVIIVTGGGEVKKIPPTPSHNHSKDSSIKPSKNGPAPAMPNNSDIRPAKSKADAVDVAPVRPSKQQQQQQQPQKEKQQSQAATAVEDFPTLGTVTFWLFLNFLWKSLVNGTILNSLWFHH